MMPNNNTDSTTQDFLDIFDITNNLVIMKDGTTSLIITVDAMNFGLLAEEEQDSIMYAYAGLLNSLNYPIQILIRSQTKDVTGYLKLLKEQEDSFLDRKKQIGIQKYREFVSNLIRERNVLDKKFFVVIPTEPVELGILTATSILPGKGKVNITSIDRNLILERAKNILEPKRDHLIAQFARIGLYSRQLETQEIIKLFYLSYNPEASEGQQIGNSNSYTTPLVSAQIEGNIISKDLPQVPTEETISPPPLSQNSNENSSAKTSENPTVLEEQNAPHLENAVTNPVITPEENSTPINNTEPSNNSPMPPLPEIQ